MQWAPRSVQRYVKSMGLPVVRVGRHVYSSPALTDVWLVSVAQRKPDAKLRRPAP